MFRDKFKDISFYIWTMNDHYRKKSKKGPSLYFFRVFPTQALKRIGPKIEYGLLYLKLHWGKQILQNKTKNTKHWGMCRMLFCPVIILQHGEITA